MSYENKEAPDSSGASSGSAFILAGYRERIGNWMWFDLFGLDCFWLDSGSLHSSDFTPAPSPINIANFLRLTLLVGSLMSMKGETAERILSAANALMVERGYSAFSYADISQAVEITKASIHFHFPTKASLVVAVLKAHREKLVQGTELLDQQIANPLARIYGYMQYWEGCIRGGSLSFCIAALLGAELPSLPEEVQAEVRLHFIALEQWLEKTLKAGVEQRVIKLQAPAATEAQVLMAVIHGAMLSARASGACDVFKVTTDAALMRTSTAAKS